jgi:2-aminoethylphosphonate transport system permease protein
MSGVALEAVVARPRRAAGPRTRGLWLLPPLVIVAVFFGYPLVLVAGQSLTTDTGFGLGVWADVLGSAEFRDAAGQTVLLALGATTGCVLLGTFLALVVAFVPFPGARTLSRLVDTVLAFPSFLIALAFTFLYGSAGVFGAGGFLYSPWGVLLAEITFYTPFVMRPALAAFGQVPGVHLDVAASLGARPGRVLWRVVLPAALPSLADAAAGAERVRHRAVPRREGRHDAADAGLRQGDRHVRLPGGERRRAGRRRDFAAAVRELPGARGKGSRCCCGRGVARYCCGWCSAWCSPSWWRRPW